MRKPWDKMTKRQKKRRLRKARRMTKHILHEWDNNPEPNMWLRWTQWQFGYECPRDNPVWIENL